MWPLPTAIATTPLSGAIPAESKTGAGRFDWASLLPLPSWPVLLAPQHCAVPFAVRAQVSWDPAERATTPAIGALPVESNTKAGIAESFAWPFPSCPEVPSPQHVASAELVTTHVE